MFCGRKHSKAAKLLQRSLPKGRGAKLPCAKATATKQSSDSKLTPRKDNSSFMDNWHHDSITAVSPELELPVVRVTILCAFSGHNQPQTQVEDKNPGTTKGVPSAGVCPCFEYGLKPHPPLCFLLFPLFPHFVLRISDFVSCGQYNLCLLSVVGMKECAEE